MLLLIPLKFLCIGMILLVTLLPVSNVYGQTNQWIWQEGSIFTLEYQGPSAGGSPCTHTIEADVGSYLSNIDPPGVIDYFGPSEIHFTFSTDRDACDLTLNTANFFMVLPNTIPIIETYQRFHDLCNVNDDHPELTVYMCNVVSTSNESNTNRYVTVALDTSNASVGDTFTIRAYTSNTSGTAPAYYSGDLTIQMSELPDIDISNCPIATAVLGTELAPLVQNLRETRDNTVYHTESGNLLMTNVLAAYYTVAPTIAQWEEESPEFKEAIKVSITPALYTLSILNYVNIDSELDMIFYATMVISLIVGMYVGVPSVALHLVLKMKKKPKDG